MNTVTFYSFKGGVGRSLALSNVAFELANSGNRVLVVDFDLEAPGLDATFPPSGATPTPGIVEFVLSYLSGSEPPDVRDYVYPWMDDGSASVLVMPAGLPSDSYARKLSSIDWLDLYERHQGFLMFEDLKAQWAKRLDVDYVLIDSRTGHTDVTGICTRQLPDTVVVTFFPNDQNLKGLTKVVGDIRSEPQTTGRDKIQLLFVASNIPNLDDEENILRRRLVRFRSRLGAHQMSVVHRYDSLHLLDRPLFTRDRPGSRLARELAAIANELKMANVEDREGAIGWLNRMRRQPDQPDELERRLSRIEGAHSADGEVLFRLGRVRLRLGQLKEAAAHHVQAIETGFARPEVYLSYAETLQRLGHNEKASKVVVSVFHDSSTTAEILHRAIELLRLLNPAFLTRLIGSQAVNDLPHRERIGIATGLDQSLQERRIAYEMVAPLAQRASGKEDWFDDAQFLVGSAAIVLGNFAEADSAFRTYLATDPEHVPSAFNLAVARWGLTSAPDPAMFRRSLLTDAPDYLRRTPNYTQCMALARAIAGDAEGALADLVRSREMIHRQTGFEFSCWRYLRISRDQFLEDLQEMEDWIGGAPVSPQFLATSQQLEISHVSRAP